MSASVCSSSRRIPVRVTKSSTEVNLGGVSNGKIGCAGCDRCVGGDGCVQSCEHVLQKYDPAFTVSIIDSSSHPHFGHIVGIRSAPVTERIPNPESLIPAFSI